MLCTVVHRRVRTHREAAAIWKLRVVAQTLGLRIVQDDTAHTRIPSPFERIRWCTLNGGLPGGRNRRGRFSTVESPNAFRIFFFMDFRYASGTISCSDEGKSCNCTVTAAQSPSLKWPRWFRLFRTERAVELENGQRSRRSTSSLANVVAPSGVARSDILSQDNAYIRGDAQRFDSGSGSGELMHSSPRKGCLRMTGKVRGLVTSVVQRVRQDLPFLGPKK